MINDNNGSTPSPLMHPRPVIGWASQNGGTTGGAGPGSVTVENITSIAQLRAEIARLGSTPKVLWLRGTIDVSEGRPYQNRADQSARGTVRLPANTTLVGMDASAKIIEGAFFVENVRNVIVRNLFIENPVDVDPQFEPGDGWNAEWDGLSIVSSQNVWVDHVTFSDGRFTMDQYQTVNGWKFVQHDGALDIKRGADFVTVSNCRFELHDKTILIGHSDSNGAQDAGRLRVTFTENLFTRIVQRTPRVRFGSVHLFNNVFDNDRNDPIYAYQYSYGIGLQSTTRSERNAFNIGGLGNACAVMKEFGGTLAADSGSTFNGASANLNACGFNPNIGAPPPYPYAVREMTPAVIAEIRRQAGSGTVNFWLIRD